MSNYLPPELQYPEFSEIQRKRKLAEMLFQQGMTPAQGQMVSGHYVAPSWSQQLAKGVSAYMGQKGIDEADMATKALAGSLRTQGQQDVTDFMNAARGTQSQAPLTPNDDQGNPMPMAQGQAPDMNRALSIAMGSNNPMLNNLAGGILSAQFTKTPKWEKIELPQPDGTKLVGMYDANSPNPLATFKAGGMAPVDPNQPFAPGGVPNKAFQDYQMGLRHAGATTVNQILNQKQEGAESTAVGGAFGKQYNDIQEAGLNAYGKINKLDRMQGLLEGIQTGKLTPAMTDVAAIADSFGIKLDKNLGPKQAAEALSNELALQMRNPSGGAGMPGALSDKDREFLKAMTPGLAKTPEGNRLLIGTQKLLAQRDLDVAKLARDYRRRNGHMDEGFYEELSKFSNANPLFTGMKTQSTPAQGAEGGVKFLGFE